MKGFLKKREGEIFIVIGILIIIYDYFYGIDTQDLLFFNQEFGIGLFGLSYPLILSSHATFSGALINK